jgi:hypothetical protein
MNRGEKIINEKLKPEPLIEEAAPPAIFDGKNLSCIQQKIYICSCL